MAHDQPILAFIHIYKAAGTTFTGILRRNFGIHHFDTRLLKSDSPMTAAQFRRVRMLYPGIRSLAGHGIRPFTDLRDARPRLEFCTFLRDPVARLISAFQFSSIKRVKDQGWNPTDSGLSDYLEQNVDYNANGLRDAFVDGGDLDAALGSLRNEVGFVGVVEEYDTGLAVLREWAAAQGIDIDVRYRRSNVTEQSEGNGKDPAAEATFSQISEFVARIKADPAIVGHLEAMAGDDLAVYREGRRKFEALKLHYPVALGPSIEDASQAEDTAVARRYRDLVGRPLIPFLTRYFQ